MSCLLNQFPREILHCIFEYLWAHEILYAFCNINDYLNDLLYNYNSYLLNLKSIRKSHFDLICQIQPHQVISLILSDNCDTPNQSLLFLTIFPITQLTRLRALKLIDLDDNGRWLCSDLSKLKNLVSLDINMLMQIPVILTAPPLRRLVINRREGIHPHCDPPINGIRSEQLRHLSLYYCSCIELQKIFRQAVWLTSLKLWYHFTHIDTEEVITLANFHQGQSIIPNLTSLSLTITSFHDVITRVHLEGFLAPLQRLKQLELVVSYGGHVELLNGYSWETFILQHLSQLVTFNFNFSVDNIKNDILEQYRRPFWLNKQWFVACDSQHSSLFTVPYFSPTSSYHPYIPVPSNWTTLPIEQHHVFYDRVIDLTFGSEQETASHHYNYIKKLCIEGPDIQKNALDLSTVKTLRVQTFTWSFSKVVLLIQKSMPSVNHLHLNCSYPIACQRILSKISLPQIRTLHLPDYARCLDDDSFEWSALFPCVERLFVTVDSKHQIAFLIDQFKNMISGHFLGDIGAEKPIKITRQWLKKHTHRLRGKNMNNSVCQINHRVLFSLYVWLGENVESDQEWMTCDDD